MQLPVCSMVCSCRAGSSTPSLSYECKLSSPSACDGMVVAQLRGDCWSLPWAGDERVSQLLGGGASLLPPHSGAVANASGGPNDWKVPLLLGGGGPSSLPGQLGTVDASVAGSMLYLSPTNWLH